MADSNDPLEQFREVVVVCVHLGLLLLGLGYWEFSCASISAVLRQGPQAPFEHSSRPTKQFWTVPCWPNSIRHSRTCLSVQGAAFVVEVAMLSVDVDPPVKAELAGAGAGGGDSSLPQAPSMGAIAISTNVSRARTNVRIMHKTPTSNNDILS